MEIRTNTPELLVAEHRPWRLGLALIAVVLIPVAFALFLIGRGQVGSGMYFLAVAAGVALFPAVYVKRIRLVLDSAAGQARITRRTVLGTRTLEWRLGEIRTAATEERLGARGKGYRPVFILASGRTEPINPVYYYGRQATILAAAINAWLAANAARI